MPTRLLKHLFIVILLLAGIGCSGSQSLFNRGDRTPPVKVLMVTATHGFRHGEAIDAAKMMAETVSANGEIEIDVTEEMADLTAENLSTYDVLFFANSTLRAANDLSEEELEAAADPAKGNWGSWDIEMPARRGKMEAKIAIDEEDGVYSGRLLAGNGQEPLPLTRVSVEGNTLMFDWSMGNQGSATATAEIDGDALQGTVRMGDNEAEFTGVRTGPDEVDRSQEELVQKAHRDAIQAFVQSGKGVVVAHAGLDALYEWDWYREMVGGGLFQEHPWNQPVKVVVEEPGHPGVAHYGESFEIRDEIYVLDVNPRWNSRVLASLDMHSVGIAQGPADKTENDHPISWVRTHDGGKVFVTQLGHYADVWQNPAFQEHLLQGIRMVAGRVPAGFGGHRVKDVIADNVWPDDIAVDELGNVWIVELRGKVHYYDAELDETRQVAEIATTDPTGIEHGVYGVEVDPDFHNGSPYVYIYYAEPNTFINTLSRFPYRNGTLELDNEEVLLRLPTEPQCCHQAGDLEWGTDGTLFLSTGDTGYSGTRPTWEISEERIEAFKEKYDLKDYHWTRLVDSERTAQNLTDNRGKILRINKDGTIPKDNPFYGQPGVRWDIYAYGLRNPYRFKVDHETGALHIGVVGPDGGHDYDEYNISENGGENFGWPRTIGPLFYNEWTPDMIPGYVPPTWEYTYELGGRSATVGPIYRSEGEYAFPDFMQDKVFVFDWSRRWIKYADVADMEFTSDQERDVRNTPLDYSAPAKRLTNIKQFDQLVQTTPISMELGPDGSLYVAEFDGFWTAGPNARVTRYRWVADEESAPEAMPEMEE